MKKRTFSILLILALILTALAGCGENNTKPDDDDDDKAQLNKGYYEVTDEEGDPAGYLEVKKSEIVVYDDDVKETDSLSYEYNEKKDRYDLDGGELFGGDRFTVEKDGKKLTLIADDGEYTLKKIDELPDNNNKKKDDPTPNPEESDDPDSDYVELPTGYYAVYDGRSLEGYLEVTRRTIVSYDADGYEMTEENYSYARDGSCTTSQFSLLFTYDRGDYYMGAAGEEEVYLLEPIDEIPTPGPSNDDVYYISGNGSIDLYLWLPEEMYDDIDIDREDEAVMASVDYYDYDNDSELVFYSILASGDDLEIIVDEAQSEYNYGSDADAVYEYLRDNIFINLLEELGGDTDYTFDEGDVDINSRNWNYCDLYMEEGDAQVYMAMLFWMRGDDMAVVFIGGNAEDYTSFDVSEFILDNIIYTLELDV